MLLEAKRAHHGMHVVVSGSVVESTTNERTIFDTTELIDSHVHMQHIRTQYAWSTRHAGDATHTHLTLTVTATHAASPDLPHTNAHISTRTINASPAASLSGQWRVHGSQRTVVPCKRPCRRSRSLQHLAHLACAPLPLLLTSGRAAKEANGCNPKAAFCVYGEARQQRERSYVQCVSSRTMGKSGPRFGGGRWRTARQG